MFKYLKYLSLLPNVIQFIMAAEEVFRSIRAGQVKREYVMNAISILFSMLTSTGVLKKDDIEKGLVLAPCCMWAGALKFIDLMAVAQL